MDTPSAILLAAADRVRDLAAHFATYHGKDDEWVYWNVERNANQDARRWIAALSPATAGPVETILRCAAKTCADAEADGWSDANIRADADESMRAAFALAESILGSGVVSP